VVATKWNAQLTSAPVHRCGHFYVNLIKAAGEPGAANYSFSECSNRWSSHTRAMGTTPPSVLGDRRPEDQRDRREARVRTGPGQEDQGRRLAVGVVSALEHASKHKDAAGTFMDWATSKTYINYAGPSSAGPRGINRRPDYAP